MASATGSTERLREFWRDAQLPSDRWLYYEFQSRRYAAIAEFLRPFGPWAGRRILDLGGGVGSLAVGLANELGGTYELAEYAPPSPPHAAALAHRGVGTTYQVDLSRPDPLDGVPRGYDAILLVEVLEHLLVNPLRLFRTIHDHLKPDGWFFLTTPNQLRAGNRWRMLAGRSIKEHGRYPWQGPGVYGHVVEFSVEELALLARAESFLPVRSRVVQQRPSVAPGRVARAGVRVLNAGWARRLELGDDILAIYRRVDRPADGRCPVPLDASGRV